MFLWKCHYLLTNSRQMALCIKLTNELAKKAGWLPCHWAYPQHIPELSEPGTLRMGYGSHQ